MLGLHWPTVGGRILASLGLLIGDAVGLQCFGAIQRGPSVLQLRSFDRHVAGSSAVQMAYPLDSGTCRDCSVEGQSGGRDPRWLGLCRGVRDWAAGCLAFAQIQKTGLFIWRASRAPRRLLALPGHSLWLHAASQLLGFGGLTGLGQRQLAEGW